MLLQRVLFEISLRMQFKAVARRGTTNIGKIYSNQMYSISKAVALAHFLFWSFPITPMPARQIGKLLYPLFILSGAELPPDLISHNITHRMGAGLHDSTDADQNFFVYSSRMILSQLCVIRCTHST